MDDVDKKALARLTAAAREAYDLARVAASALPAKRRDSIFGPGYDDLNEAEHLLRAASHLTSADAGVAVARGREQYISHAEGELRWLRQELERREQDGRKEWLSARLIERIQALHLEVAELAILFPKEGAT